MADPNIGQTVTSAWESIVSAKPEDNIFEDYWLLNQYPSEEDIAATQKGLTSRPIGTPRNKADIVLGNTP